MEFDEGFTWLVHVIAKKMLNQSNEARLYFKAWCVSYLLCHTLGVTFQFDFNWDEINPLLQVESTKDFRSELKEIKYITMQLYDQIKAVVTEHKE